VIDRRIEGVNFQLPLPNGSHRAQAPFKGAPRWLLRACEAQPPVLKRAVKLQFLKSINEHSPAAVVELRYFRYLHFLFVRAHI
jgi:hypothetical protein